MLLNELKESLFDCDININLKIKGNKYEFSSKIINFFNENLIIEPIMIDGKILNLDRNDIFIDIVANRKTNKPIIWNNCKIKIINVDKKNINKKYLVIIQSPGREINRRNDFRLDLGINGISLISSNTKSRIVNVRNISASGLGLTINNKELENFNKDLKDQHIRVLFEDTELNYKFILEGTIIRVDDISIPGYTILGVQLIKKYIGLNQYIMNRQRLDVSKKMNVGFKEKSALKKSFESNRKIIK